MNRLKDYFNDPDEPERSDDYYEIETHYDSFPVSAETAREVEQSLEAAPTPRWVIFRDVTGARHRLVVAHIYRISECTAAQRASRREFWRARKEENERDRRPWEDD